MGKISKLRDFDYTNDRLVVADMDNRDKSFIVLILNKLNEAIDAINGEIEIRKNMQKDWGKKVEQAEKQAAESIKDSAQ